MWSWGWSLIQQIYFIEPRGYTPVPRQRLCVYPSLQMLESMSSLCRSFSLLSLGLDVAVGALRVKLCRETNKEPGSRCGPHKLRGQWCPDSIFVAKLLSRPSDSTGPRPLGWWSLQDSQTPKQKRRDMGALCFSRIFYICLFGGFPLTACSFRVCFSLPFPLLFFNHKCFSGDNRGASVQGGAATSSHRFHCHHYPVIPELRI